MREDHRAVDGRREVPKSGGLPSWTLPGTRVSRSLRILLLLALLGIPPGCARRLPPPGKPETRGPILHLLEPSEGDTVQDTLRVRVQASDSSGVAWVRVQLDQTLVGADSSAPYEFLYPLDQVVDTVHHLAIQAADRWDNLSRVRVWIVTRGGVPPARPPGDTLQPPTPQEEPHAPHKKN